MKIYKVPENLYNKYQGCGYAIAVTKSELLIDFCYFCQILEDFDVEQNEDEESLLRKTIQDKRVLEVCDAFSPMGDVRIGFLSCYEFCER